MLTFGRNFHQCCKTLPFSTRVFTPYMQNRLFSSSNGVIGAATTLQPKPGTPVHQGKMPFIDAFLPQMNKKIWSRRSMILLEFVNCNVRIYNGKNFIRRKITEAMVGHKFGEFAFTRKRMKLKTKAPYEAENQCSRKKEGEKVKQ